MKLQQLSIEERKEMSFIEIAESIFEERRESISFKDLVDEIATFLELSPEEVKPRMLQFYTDLNVNGRFLSLGENRWGLREWYPIDQIDEEVIIPTKTKKKKKKAKDEDDLIEDLDEEELDFDLDEDGDFDDADEIEEEEEDESLEALREEEEELDEDELLEDDDYEIEDDEEEDIELDEEEEEEEEEE